MNQEQVLGIVRWAVGIGLAWATGKGHIGTETATQIGIAAGAIALAVWSWFSNKTKPTVPPS